MIQLYVIMFVSGFQQVAGFCQVQKFKKFIQRIKLTACAILFTEIWLNVVIFIIIYLFIFFFQCHFQQYFSYIMATSFSCGRSREYPERTTDHGQATGKLYHLWLRVQCTIFSSTCQRQCELLSSLVIRRLSSVNFSHFNLLL